MVRLWTQETIIMTSGFILVKVTGVVGGMFEEETVQAIVKTLSIGSFYAIVLIMFILYTA